jgi:hypothetical protein
MVNVNAKEIVLVSMGAVRSFRPPPEVLGSVARQNEVEVESAP